MSEATARLIPAQKTGWCCMGHGTPWGVDSGWTSGVGSASQQWSVYLGSPLEVRYGSSVAPNESHDDVGDSAMRALLPRRMMPKSMMGFSFIALYVLPLPVISAVPIVQGAHLAQTSAECAREVDPVKAIRSRLVTKRSSEGLKVIPISGIQSNAGGLNTIHFTSPSALKVRSPQAGAAGTCR